MRRYCTLQTLKDISEHGVVSGLLHKDPMMEAYALSIEVIALILEYAFDELSPDERPYVGGWIVENIIAKNPNTEYLRSMPNLDSFLDAEDHFSRITDIADLLFNLQWVPGIEQIYRRIVKQSDQIEATLLELEGLRMLTIGGLPFRILHDGAGQGLNYECEIITPTGLIAYCEMKCKIESTVFSVASLKNAFNKARKQLPKGKCGVLFLKVHTNWIEDAEIRTSLDKTIYKLLGGTERITVAVCYSRHKQLSGGKIFSQAGLREYVNQKSPFVDAIGKSLIVERLRQAINPPWLSFWGLTKERIQKILEDETRDRL